LIGINTVSKEVSNSSLNKQDLSYLKPNNQDSSLFSKNEIENQEKVLENRRFSKMVGPAGFEPATASAPGSPPFKLWYPFGGFLILDHARRRPLVFKNLKDHPIFKFKCLKKLSSEIIKTYILIKQSTSNN
jgi:hypothetical protein